MCVVIDLNVVCLICLQPSKDFHPIFTADSDDPELQIAQKISILSELKIDQNNQTLPSKICSKCFQDLKIAWRFRKNCKAAVTIFQTIIKLENVQPGNSAIKDTEEQKVKVPHGLQILLTTTKADNESGEGKSGSQKTADDEEINNCDKVESTLYEALGPNVYVETHDGEADEFQVLEETGENEDNEDFESDENNLVEYYLTEDGISEEIVNIQETVNKQATAEKQTNSTIYVENSNKPSLRGRPRKQNLIQKEKAKSKNVQTKRKGTIFIDSANSSEETIQHEIRQVKTRKRKPISPERKTPKICEICGNSYRFQHALNAHMRRHYNDKPFPCECCDKAFVSNVELRRHMRVHTGQKPYACQYCERRFSDFGSRIKHERTHTGERPYHCVTCGKSFAYPHVLSVHLRTHTGEKRFRCDHCNKGFTKKAYLTSHLAQLHNSFQIIIEDTMVKSQNRLKSETFEEYICPTEFINEEPIDEDEEYAEDTNKGPGKNINKSIMKPKMETYDEAEVQSIEEEPEDFALSEH